MLIYATYFESSVPKLFLNNRMNICLILGKKYFRFRGWNSYIRTILSARAGIAAECDNVIVTLLLLKWLQQWAILLISRETKKSFFRSWKARTIQCQNLTKVVPLTKECIIVLQSNVDSIKEKIMQIYKKSGV